MDMDDTTLVSLMAAIIFSSCQGTTSEAVEKAKDILEWVETPAKKIMERKRKSDDCPF